MSLHLTGAETETDEVIDVFIEENIPSDEPHFGASKSKVQYRALCTRGMVLSASTLQNNLNCTHLHVAVSV